MDKAEIQLFEVGLRGVPTVFYIGCREKEKQKSIDPIRLSNLSILFFGKNSKNSLQLNPFKGGLLYIKLLNVIKK